MVKALHWLPCMNHRKSMHYNLAVAYLAQKQIDEAISELTEVLRRYPDFAPAQRSLAEARQQREK